MAGIELKKEGKISEPAFESLIFPFKKQWVAKRPNIRSRKSIAKKNIVALKMGTNQNKTVLNK